MLDYPDVYYRGISSPDFVSQGHVLAAAFQFSDCEREDGFKELSINWGDSDEALEELLKRKKETDDKLQFRAGVAKMSLASTRVILKAFLEENNFSYEKCPAEGNPYHGNLLESKTLGKSVAALVSNGLALCVGELIQQQ